MSRYSLHSPSLTIIKGTIDKETAKAVLVKTITYIDDQDATEVVEELNALNSQWFPLSRIHKLIHSKSIGNDEIHVETWICKEKGLVD